MLINVKWNLIQDLIRLVKNSIWNWEKRLYLDCFQDWGLHILILSGFHFRSSIEKQSNNHLSLFFLSDYLRSYSVIMTLFRMWTKFYNDFIVDFRYKIGWFYYKYTRNNCNSSFLFLFFLGGGTSTACGSFWARDQTCTIAVTTPDPLTARPPNSNI